MNEEQKRLKILGKCLKRRRIIVGHSQEEMENYAEINHKHYSKIELGLINPSYTYLVEISKALNTSLASIVNEADRDYYSSIDNDDDNE